MRTRLYEDLVRGVIDQDELDDFSAAYDSQISEKEIRLSKVQADMEEYARGVADASWLDVVERWKDAKEITRPMAVELIDRIEIREDKSVNVVFRFADKMEAVLDAVGGDPR